MKTRSVFLGVVSGILINTAFSLGAQDAEKAAPIKRDTVTPTAAALSPSLAEKLKAAAANLSPPVMEIVRMSDAGADATVIQAFVENSPNAYSLRAEEIIYLHDHGISTPIITAMIQHGGKPQAQTAPAAPPPSASDFTLPPAAPDYAASPTYVYPSYTSSPTYAYEYPSYPYVSYPGFGVYLSWPYYYGHSHYGRSFGGGLRFSHSGTFRSGGHFSFGHR